MKFFLILLVLPSIAFAESISFQEPADVRMERKTSELPPSTLIPNNTEKDQFHCDIYKDYVIQIPLVSGLKGIDYKIVRKNKKATVEDLCSPATKLKSFSVHYGDIVGIQNGIIIFRGEEPMGDIDHLVFYDLQKGKEIYSVKYSVSNPVLIKKSGRSLGLDLHYFIGGPRENCNVLQDADGSCLKKVLVRNKVPSPKSFQSVNCEESLKADAKLANAGSVDLFLGATIKNIRYPKVRFTGKTIACALAP